jgi:O-6-methylguanine DNA methyltransferase
MKTEFKNVLETIDKIAYKDTPGVSLFGAIDPADTDGISVLQNWSGKSVDSIKRIMSTAYGKQQILFNPFVDSGSSMHSPIVFSKMLPGENPDIQYALEETDYGNIIIASTKKGICYLVFYSGSEEKISDILKKEFPGSVNRKGSDEFQRAALNYLKGNYEQVVYVHVKGTDEQLQIWHALTKVPSGKLISYGTLAKATNNMAQDIGAAMGDNRIAMLIPCHRVIKATGEPGQYHWGAKRKQAMIIKESVLA